MSVIPPEPVDVLPTVTEVAALARARTVDNESEQEGTFTANTRPTDTQVAELIEQAADEVQGRSGSVDFFEPCAGVARHSIVLYTCCLIELSYYPEQVNEEASAYDRFKTLFDEALAALIDCVLGGSAGEDGASGYRGGIYSVPMHAVGWRGDLGDTEDLIP